MKPISVDILKFVFFFKIQMELQTWQRLLVDKQTAAQMGISALFTDVYGSGN